MYTAQGNHALTTSAPPPLAAMPGSPEKCLRNKQNHRGTPPAIDFCTDDQLTLQNVVFGNLMNCGLCAPKNG